MGSFQSSAQLFASLDHCYNISSTHLDNEKYMVKNSGPLTPPVSSDEEDSQTTFSYNLNTHPRKNRSTIKTKHNLNKVQSLLKKSQQKSSNEAKFSFKVNLKTDADSQIKQRLLEHQKLKTCQSAIRKRKERSLKMQEGEAREVHNQMERQRRNELKLSYDKLKTVLPEIAESDKASKQQILDKAVETCKVIKSTEQSLQNRKNSLTKSNALLKEKLRLLKAEVKRKNSLDLGIGQW